MIPCLHGSEPYACHVCRAGFRYLLAGERLALAACHVDTGYGPEPFVALHAATRAHARAAGAYHQEARFWRMTRPDWGPPIPDAPRPRPRPRRRP